MKEDTVFQFGDMPIEDFRKNGYKVIDWIVDYLQNVEHQPVFPQINYGDIKKEIVKNPPFKGEDSENVLKDVDDVLLKGITHWNHPNFMA